MGLSFLLLNVISNYIYRDIFVGTYHLVIPFSFFEGSAPKSRYSGSGKERRVASLPSEIYSEDFQYLHGSVENEILSGNDCLARLEGHREHMFE